MKTLLWSLLLAVGVMSGTMGGYRLLFEKNEEMSLPVMATPGDFGTEVSAIQERLADLGYALGPVSGVYDAATEAAVRAFQSDKGIEPSGSANPETLYLLGLPIDGAELIHYERRRFVASTLDAVCGEAPYLVKVALAGVLYSRMETDGFPKTLPEIVYSDPALMKAWQYDYAAEPSGVSWRAARDAEEGMSPCPDALYYYHTEEQNEPRTDVTIRYKNGKHVFLG